MYHVAICEDERTLAEDLAARCASILTGLELAHDIALFSCAEELEAALSVRAEPFDLLLLDIQLPGKTGVELAVSLRRLDDRVGIIFITGTDAYAVEGYRAQPCNYLLKPVSDDALAEALRAELKRRCEHQAVVFQDRGRTVRLFVPDILYLESYNHGVRVHTERETLFFYIPLSTARTLLPPGVFFRCHNSFLVNLSRVESLSPAGVTLHGGEQLPVGRAYRAAFQSVFINHFF